MNLPTTRPPRNAAICGARKTNMPLEKLIKDFTTAYAAADAEKQAAAEAELEVVTAKLKAPATEKPPAEPEPIAARAHQLPPTEYATLCRAMGMTPPLPAGSEQICGGRTVLRQVPHGGFSIGVGGRSYRPGRPNTGAIRKLV